MEKETSFLSTIYVQCDDEDLIDSIIDDKGNVKDFIKVLKVVENNPEKVRLLSDNEIVSLEKVKASIKIITDLKESVRN